MNTWWLSNQILIQSTFISLLLALSIQVPLRAGVFSFAGIGSYAIGAYTAAILTIRAQVAPVVAIGAGVLLAAVVGYLLALLVARLSGLYLGMATISFTLFLGVLATNGGDLTGGATGLFGALSTLTTEHVIAITVVVLVLLAASERGSFGRRVDAVREDPQLAVSLGVDVVRVRRRVFVVSGALGACAGGMNTLLRTTVSPETVGFHLVVTALTIIIVGGAMSWAGAAIGAVIFTWLPSILQFVGEWQLLVYGIVVAIAAVYVPGGLLGLLQEGWRRMRRRGRRLPAEGAVAQTQAAAAVDPEKELAALAAPTTEVRP
ncbi:branched-chain amino acid ABC transporter permease [Trujillonella endophytica]|uniref:Branched-chain amino acid transport system permease protein n=1 Tax=Trujillonella endophytica TaxID=673521 RepID=A0A1H8QJ27_9ACTN|nr:branched-chain amino acid ABC transporter permease [Trujillella endophytica]SEO54255.1 branched-chain amino acid transport system permease protein [Trujillella endophytica]